MSATNLTFGELRLNLSQRFPAVHLTVLTSLINERYRRLARMLPWQDWTLQSVLQTAAVYETGTVALTKGLNTVTGTGTTFTSSMGGRGFRVPGQNAFYQFTYVSATSGTLDRVYEGETAAAAAYRIFQNVYPLA